MTDKPRQRIYVGLHVNPDTCTFAPEVQPAGDGSGIAAVRVVDGLTIQSSDAASLRLLADAFGRAADSLADTASSVSRQHYIDTGEYLPARDEQTEQVSA